MIKILKLLFAINLLYYSAKAQQAPIPQQQTDSVLVYGQNYEKAHFPGGDSVLNRYLKNNITYPIAARENGIQGRLRVRVMIDETGLISKPVIIRGLDAQCDSEAIRLVRAMPPWVPATYKKKPTKSIQEIILSFRLQ
ncbi:MAG: TonB family protein [Taibaiella sp.]|nr:TonB family protein [Taibaiella sp.]